MGWGRAEVIVEFGEIGEDVAELGGLLLRWIDGSIRQIRGYILEQVFKRSTMWEMETFENRRWSGEMGPWISFSQD